MVVLVVLVVLVVCVLVFCISSRISNLQTGQLELEVNQLVKLSTLKICLQ